MDKRCAAHAEDVRKLFQAPSPKRESSDAVRERDRAKRIRLLPLPELDDEAVEPEDKEEEGSGNTKQGAPTTSISHNTSPSRDNESNPIAIRQSAGNMTEEQDQDTRSHPSDEISIKVGT